MLCSCQILTNLTSMKSVIVPVDGLTYTPALIPGSTPVLNTTDDLTSASAVINTQYTCNVRKLKSFGSLVVGVISGTLSMFL
jgi:hypothetical protein